MSVELNFVILSREDMHANADDEDHVTAHLTQLNA